MLKARRRMTIRTGHPGARLACIFMALAAGVRLWHYLPSDMDAQTLWVHLLLPTLAAAVFLAGMAAGPKWALPASMAAVALGVAFFLLKARAFAPLHRALCTLLYLAVLVLYNAAVLGLIPTKKLLCPLFGLPFLYHLLVEDTRLYFFAQPPVPVWDWMPEISVLCIMAGLFCLTFAIEENRQDISDS